MLVKKALQTMLLSSAMLIALAGVAGAAETAAPVAEVIPVVAAAAPADQAFVVKESECDRAPLYQAAFAKPTAAFSMQCGGCSSGGCAGGFIGQMCWTGGINGQWGNCNLYTGGYMCSDGNWECSCGAGPIP